MSKSAENSHLLFANHDIRRVWMLHANDVIAGIDVMDFPGHATRHIREQIGARVHMGCHEVVTPLSSSAFRRARNP